MRIVLHVNCSDGVLSASGGGGGVSEVIGVIGGHYVERASRSSRSQLGLQELLGLLHVALHCEGETFTPSQSELLTGTNTPQCVGQLEHLHSLASAGS